MFAAELQEETDKLAAAYETMLQQAEKERRDMAARADQFAAEVVLHKARLERFEALVPLMRKRIAALRIDLARVTCRLVSKLATERKAWRSEKSALTVALEHQTSVATEMGTAVASAQTLILAAKQTAVDEVRSGVHVAPGEGEGEGGRTGREGRGGEGVEGREELVHLAHLAAWCARGATRWLASILCTPVCQRA